MANLKNFLFTPSTSISRLIHRTNHGQWIFRPFREYVSYANSEISLSCFFSPDPLSPNGRDRYPRLPRYLTVLPFFIRTFCYRDSRYVGAYFLFSLIKDIGRLSTASRLECTSLARSLRCKKVIICVDIYYCYASEAKTVVVYQSLYSVLSV